MIRCPECGHWSVELEDLFEDASARGDSSEGEESSSDPYVSCPECGTWVTLDQLEAR